MMKTKTISLKSPDFGNRIGTRKIEISDEYRNVFVSISEDHRGIWHVKHGTQDIPYGDLFNAIEEAIDQQDNIDYEEEEDVAVRAG